MPGGESGRASEDSARREDLALRIFRVLDADGDGHLELSELRATLQRLDPTFTDDDVAQVFGFFPRDEGGRVTERDFVRGVETMKAFS